ncbi:hypothetical protein GGS21DRAFT_513395 [Xylaria nigripes]|nr:hypothetical protein GGS21DRAFT_513395 [Xylaria nigripes]
MRNRCLRAPLYTATLLSHLRCDVALAYHCVYQYFCLHTHKTFPASGVLQVPSRRISLQIRGPMVSPFLTLDRI